MANKYALGVEYSGGPYCGWQFQGHSSETIQFHLQRALTYVANEPILVQSSGRTDAGVHALEQVCHFETRATRSEFGWRQGVNTKLPASIRVKWVKSVDMDFDARRKALFRDYIYIVQQTSVASALWGGIVTPYRHKLHLESMARALTYIRGEHDFSAFKAAGCQAKHPVRRILETDVWQSQNFIGIAVRGNAFLHHMIRNIVGSLLEIGQREKPIHWIDELLQGRDRALAAPTAPAQGLYFRTTHYGPRWGLTANSGSPFGLFDEHLSQWPTSYPAVDFGDRL